MTTRDERVTPGVLGLMLSTNAWLLDQNLAGISHEESVRAPRPAGNPVNWVLGHLVCWRRSMLELLGGEPVDPAEGWDLYRGGGDDGPDWAPESAHPLELLHGSFHEAQSRLTATLDEEDILDRLARFHRGESVGQRVFNLLTHETYHVGQTGLQRRLLGLPGAV